MHAINIQAAKTHLSRLVDQAAAGKEIILAKAGKPLAKLVPYAATRKPRTPGLLKGQFHESPGCWDPDPEMEALFNRDDPLLHLDPAQPEQTTQVTNP